MLENKLGITSSPALAEAEERISKKKAVELFESGILDTLEAGKFVSLQTIHRVLFEDIYDFAGKIRTVNLAKGSFRFAPLMYLDAALQSIDKMPQSNFDQIVEKYVEMNIAHPFRDGNGRTARILNASQLYHAGYRKMKSLPLSSAINNQLSGYYSSLADSETVQGGTQDKWLDISPFVSFMMDAFEHCLIDAALADNALTEAEKKLLERMNHAGNHAEITTKKAAGILQMSDSGTRAVLNGLVNKGYLTVEKDVIPYVYRLHQHIPE